MFELKSTIISQDRLLCGVRQSVFDEVDKNVSSSSISIRYVEIRVSNEYTKRWKYFIGKA